MNNATARAAGCGRSKVNKKRTSEHVLGREKSARVNEPEVRRVSCFQLRNRKNVVRTIFSSSSNSVDSLKLRNKALFLNSKVKWDFKIDRA